MEQSGSLARLEEFVDTLLNRHAQLKADYLALQRNLHERDQEIQRLKQEKEHLESEREEVGSRVAKLLGRIERWQDEQALSGPASTGLGQGSGLLMTGEPD